MRDSRGVRNRMMEEQLSQEPGARKSRERHGRGDLSDGRAMSDAQLLENLHGSNVEIIDDKMQLGYDAWAEGRGDVQQTCRLWLEVWRDVLSIMQRRQVQSFDEFDRLYGGMQSVFSWVQDLEQELYNAGRDNPEFFRERISICQTVLERFPDEEELLIQNFKRGLPNWRE